MGVVEGWQNGRSRNHAVNEVFRRIHELLAELQGAPTFHPRYVPNADNPADGPSRGIYPPKSLLLPPVHLPKCLDELIIDSQSPLTPAERKLWDEGNFPRAAAKAINNSHGSTEEHWQQQPDPVSYELRRWHFEWPDTTADSSKIWHSLANQGN